MEHKPSLCEYILKTFPTTVGAVGAAYCGIVALTTLAAANEANSNSLRALGIAIASLDMIAAALLAKLCYDLEGDRKPLAIDNTATP